MWKTFHLLDVFGQYILIANNGMHATRGWLESGRRLRCKNRPWSSGVDIHWIDTDMSMLKWMMYSIAILSYLVPPLCCRPALPGRLGGIRHVGRLDSCLVRHHAPKTVRFFTISFFTYFTTEMLYDRSYMHFVSFSSLSPKCMHDSVSILFSTLHTRYLRVLLFCLLFPDAPGTKLS